MCRSSRTAAGAGSDRSFLPPASTAYRGLERQEHRQHHHEHQNSGTHGTQDDTACVPAAPSRHMPMVTGTEMIDQISCCAIVWTQNPLGRSSSKWTANMRTPTTPTCMFSPFSSRYAIIIPTLSCAGDAHYTAFTGFHTAERARLYIDEATPPSDGVTNITRIVGTAVQRMRLVCIYRGLGWSVVRFVIPYVVVPVEKGISCRSASPRRAQASRGFLLRA